MARDLTTIGARVEERPWIGPSVWRALAERPQTLLIGTTAPPPWTPPPDLPASVIAEAQTALAAFERYMAPATPEELLVTVKALLSHFWTPELDEGVEAVALDQWIEILEGYPRRVIGEACTGWLADQQHRRRPTPGEIVALCRKRAREDQETRRRLRLIAAGPAKPRIPAPTSPRPAAIAPPAVRLDAVVEKFRDLEAERFDRVLAHIRATRRPDEAAELVEDYLLATPEGRRRWREIAGEIEPAAG